MSPSLWSCEAENRSFLNHNVNGRKPGDTFLFFISEITSAYKLKITCSRRYWWDCFGTGCFFNWRHSIIGNFFNHLLPLMSRQRKISGCNYKRVKTVTQKDPVRTLFCIWKRSSLIVAFDAKSLTWNSSRKALRRRTTGYFYAWL